MNTHCEREELSIKTARGLLQQTIIEHGEISPDGELLRLKELNRKGESELVESLASCMASWLEITIPNLKQLDPLCVVVESSGNILNFEVAKRLRTAWLIIKKGKPATMFGDILTKEIHSRTRHQPTEISVEHRDIAGRNLILIDDFAASGETFEGVEELAERAGAKIVAICVAVAKPNQGSFSVLRKIPSLAVVEIEEMFPAKDNLPAMIEFAGMPKRVLKRKWGEG